MKKTQDCDRYVQAVACLLKVVSGDESVAGINLKDLFGLWSVDLLFTSGCKKIPTEWEESGFSRMEEDNVILNVRKTVQCVSAEKAVALLPTTLSRAIDSILLTNHVVNRRVPFTLSQAWW